MADTSRRNFMKGATGLASVSILPSHMLFGENTPSNQFRFAQVGVGGKGSSDMGNTIGCGAKLVAVCDTDKNRLAGAAKKHKVPSYTDYRKMLDKHEKEIDAVVVSTPDHTHACIALDAIKRGKHVYVQKPLARTYEECQALLDAATKHKVVTQMGNQGHAGMGLKLWEKMMADDAFGNIQEVHSWSNRPIWPQGMSKLPSPQKAPAHIDWNSWLGPISDRPYSGAYLPFKWRGWWDFGCGAMGDMAIHNADPAFWILKLGHPDKVKAVKASSKAGVAYPKSSVIEMYFKKSPVTGKPIKVIWYDGHERPKMPAGSHPTRKPGGNGCMIVGSKMSVLGGSHAGRPLPVAITGAEYGKAVKEAERHWRAEGKKLSGVNHHKQWLDAAKAGDQKAPGSSFDYSALFTQSLLLACIALRFPGEELLWDQKKKKFSNKDEANEWLTFKARKGFSIKA